MLKEVLTPELVAVDLDGSDKQSVVKAMVGLLVKAGRVEDSELALADVLSHETENSTGMENGIAIPHAKTDAVQGLVACVGTTKKGVEFECLDRKPARIFVMTLSPKDGTGPHLRFLAEVARLLKDKKMRKRLLAARSDRELFEAITQ